MHYYNFLKNTGHIRYLCIDLLKVVNVLLMMSCYSNTASATGGSSRYLLPSSPQEGVYSLNSSANSLDKDLINNFSLDKKRITCQRRDSIDAQRRIDSCMQHVHRTEGNRLMYS